MAKHPIRIQRKRTKGWKMPKNTVYVGRSSKWGNPFRVVREDGGWAVVCDDGPVYGSKAVAIDLSLSLYRHLHGPLLPVYELLGKNLCCWCPLDQPCHATILLEIANA